MRTNLRATAVTLTAVAVTAFGLAGCGSSSSAGANSTPTTTGNVPSSSTGVTSSSTIPSVNTPVAAAQEFIRAIQAHDGARACAAVVPDEQALCTSQYAPLMAQMTFSGAAFHQTVVSGDRALVSVTGHLCIAGHCQGATDPASGMPSATLTFDQAWAMTKTASTATTAASPCQRVDGKWYVVID